MSTDFIRVKRNFSSSALRKIIHFSAECGGLSEQNVFRAMAKALADYVDINIDVGSDFLANLAYKTDNTDEDWPWWPEELNVPSLWLMTRELSQDLTVFACKSFFWEEHEPYYRYPNPIDRSMDRFGQPQFNTSALIMKSKVGVDEVRVVAKRIIDTTPVRESPKLVWVPDDEVMTPLGLPAGMSYYWWDTPIEEPDGSDGGVPWAMGKGAPGVWL